MIGGNGQAPPALRTQCAWCNRELTAPERGVPDDAPVGFDVCPDCVDRLLAHRKVPMRAFLDRQDGPVFLVDDDGRIHAANTAAGDLTGQDPAALEGLLGGDALECRHAREPGGCGRTVHCRSCAIRGCIHETLATGRTLHRVPAYRDMSRIPSDARPAFWISTERLGPSVLLKIEPVPPDET